MLHADCTFETPEENLACDEVLLDECDQGRCADILRFWEPTQYFVVVGYANPVRSEVNLAYCQEHHLPVLRRCSGGGTVLQGPGCLNYSLVLRITPTGPLSSISGTNDFIMGRHQTALSSLLGRPVQKQGHTDLALENRKFSGNAQRRRQHAVLFHGCFLLNLDLELLRQALPLPSKAPAYRGGRAHLDFVMNLNRPSSVVKKCLISAWDAKQPVTELPYSEIRRSAVDKYSSSEWNFKS